MKWFFPGLLVFLMCACERVADLDLGNADPELVILANFSDLDTMEVVVTKSKSVLEPGPAEYVSDAVVHIYRDGFFADRLSFIPSPIPQYPSYYVSSFLIPRPGESYRIKVSAPGFSPVEGASVMPLAVNIDTSATVLSIEKQDIDSLTAQVDFTIDLNIQLPVPKPSYFHLNFYQRINSFHLNEKGDTMITEIITIPLSFSPSDPDLPLVPYIEDRGVLFGNDAIFNNHGNLSFTGNFLFHSQDQILGDFLIELRTVSPEYYLYHRSLARLFQAGQDPFSEPVILYTNIEGGQGVFASFVSRFYNVPVAR